MSTPIETPGFGNCRECPFLLTGPPTICQLCASQTLQPPSPYYCTVCGQAYSSAVACRNGLCNDPTRMFEFNRAIAMKTGVLDDVIKRHKYHGGWGWGIIFARVLLGQLDKDPTVSTADMIIPMPSFNPTNLPRRDSDHAGWVIEKAIEQDTMGHPFRLDPPIIVKTAATARMADTTSMAVRRGIAAQLYAALSAPSSQAVHGKYIVVFDDVFTGGNSLNVVARRLREAGASRVAGLTLARQPWR